MMNVLQTTASSHMHYIVCECVGAGHSSNSPGRGVRCVEGAGQGSSQPDSAAHCGAGSRQRRHGSQYHDGPGHGQTCELYSHASRGDKDTLILDTSPGLKQKSHYDGPGHVQTCELYSHASCGVKNTLLILNTSLGLKQKSHYDGPGHGQTRELYSHASCGVKATLIPDTPTLLN